MKAYPPWFYPVLITCLLLLFISGLLLIPTVFEMRLEWDVPWRLSGSERLITTAVHTLTSYLVIMAVGALSIIHIKAGLKQRKNHYSGLVVLSLMLLLMLTGIGVFYLSLPNWVVFISLVHLVLALMVILMFLFHAFRKKAKRVIE